MNAEQANEIMNIIDGAKNDIQERVYDVFYYSDIDDDEKVEDEANAVHSALNDMFVKMNEAWSILRDMLSEEEQRKFDNL